MSEDQLSRVFAALADPTRRDIVARLAVGDATVGQLAAPYNVSIQAVSKHLKVLEGAGLVSRSQDAQRRPRHLEAGGKPRSDTAASMPYSPPWTRKVNQPSTKEQHHEHKR